MIIALRGIGLHSPADVHYCLAAETARLFLGEKLSGQSTVVEFQGSLSSINGRDRSEAFAECMSTKYPNIKVVEIPTDWDGGKARSGLQDKLLTDDVNGIYMRAGGVFLEPTLSLLSEQGKLVPAGEPGHITIISNDGIPSELEAIGRGDIDATISQPADADAQWSLFYAQAAADGKTFIAGATDHNSTIIDVGSGQLEDQLPAPVVTKDGAAVGSLQTVAAEAVGITKRFGSTVALNNVRIKIDAGRTHALVGRNGAGKPTLVSILTGLVAPTEGAVHFNGEPAPPFTDRDAWRSKVACVYQQSTIIPGLSVAENLFINGGRGSVIGAFLGILLLTVIQKLLSFGNVSAEAINAINGALILIALVITRLAGGKRQD